VGIAGAAFLPACSDRRDPTPASPRTGTSVVRTLGRTGLELPVVSMGSCYAVNLVKTALDHGLVYIHTSSGYGERNHERLLGHVFTGRARDSFVVATSPDLPYRFSPGSGRSLDLGVRADPGLIETSIEGSLERLQVDAVDIYYLCSVGCEEVRFEPYMEAFEKLKKAGKTRFIGVGTHDNEPDVIRAAIEAGVWDVVLTAYNFRQSHRDRIAEAISEAAAAGLGVVAMKTQAGVYWDRARTRMINMKAALKWVLTDENVHTAIPAFSTFDELREGLSVMDDLRLTPEEERDLELGERLDLAGNFCQQCGRCRPQCPAGVDVPTWMRASMYAFGHGQPAKARQLLRECAVPAPSCVDCDHCVVRCALGLDIRSSCLDLTRAMDAET
jgi:predicted aldo/keto reductase-like oxidoreductase